MMFLQKKIILTFLVVLMACIFPVAAQHHDPDVSWYEGFFQEKSGTSIEKALEQGKNNLMKAREINDMPATVKAFMEIGLIHLTRTYDYGQSMDSFIQALAIEDSLDLRDRQAFTYLAIAHVYQDVSDYDKSAEFLEKALNLNEMRGNPEVLALILINMGKVNASKGRIEDAFENFNKVLSLKETVQKPNVEADALFNLGHLYTLQGQYDEALRQHKLSLSIRRSVDDKKNEARSLNDIGELYKMMKNYEKALANYVVALEIRQVLRDRPGAAESFNNIGDLYYQQRNLTRAIANLELGLDAARESDDQHQMRTSYEYLSACYEALGEYKKALEYKGHFFAINDLIHGDENEQQLSRTQNRYEIVKKETQIAQHQKELEDQKNFRNFLFLLLVLSGIIVGLIIYLYVIQKRSNARLKIAHEKVNQQNLELQELNATKDKFFSIISHDLKGPLNSLTSFSSLLINHTDSLSKEEIKMFASDFDKSLKNLFALLENLLEWSRSQTGNIEFTPETFDLAAMLEENKELLKAQAQNKKITLVNDNTGPLLISAHKNSINTVVRNLISNAIKFTPEEGRITLSVLKQNGEVVASITDTGVGMSQNVIDKLFRIDSKHSTKGTANEKGTGLGLILCKEFVEKNGGRIWVTSREGEGSVFYFTLLQETSKAF